MVALVDKVALKPGGELAGDGAPVDAGAEQAVQDERGPAPADHRRFERDRHVRPRYFSPRLRCSRRGT